jgi:hypothetical protein
MPVIHFGVGSGGAAFGAMQHFICAMWLIPHHAQR